MVRDEKDDRHLLHPTRMQKQTDGRGEQKSSLGSGKENRKARETRNEIPCRFKFCKKSVMWILAPSVCPEFTSLKKGCTHGDKYHFRHVGRKAQQEVEERWCERISCDIEGVSTIGLCISRFLSEKIPILREPRNVRIKTRCHILQRHLAPNQNSGQKRVHREVLSKSVRLMSVVLPRRNSWKYHMRKTCTKKRCARRAAWELAKNIYKLKNSDQTTLYTLIQERVLPAPVTWKRPEERGSVCRFREHRCT